MKKFILLLLLLFPLTIRAEDFEISAPSGILMEYSTGKVLYEKNSHDKLAPASMTKIMTLLLIMENLKSGKINLNDEVLISNNASSMGGSQVFLDPNTKIKLEELLKAIVVASANDVVVTKKQSQVIGEETN